MSSLTVPIYPLNHNTDLEDSATDSSTKNEYVEKSLGLVPINSPVRQWLMRICTSGSKFDSFILIMILLNTVMMACVDYRFVDEKFEPSIQQSFRNYLLEKAEIVFMLIFMVECLMKVVAFGFVRGNRAYLKSAWNTFDFVIVLCR